MVIERLSRKEDVMSKEPIITPHKVSFKSDNLLLIDYLGEPHVPLLPVIEGIGLEWQSSCLKRAIRKFRVNLIKVCISSADGFNEKMECLPLRKLPAWLLAIQMVSLAVSTRRNLLAYQVGCDDALWLHWSKIRTKTTPAVSAIYQNRPFRFRFIGNECWYVAADVVSALGLRTTKSLLSTIPPQMQLVQHIGGRRLITISQAGLKRALLVAPPRHTERLRIWLASICNDPQTWAGGSDSRSISIHEASAHLTLDYISRYRSAMRAAGAELVEWDEAQAQQIAENLPWLLIRNQRWLFTLSNEGEPQFSVVPNNAGIFTPEKVVSWVRERDGAASELLPQLLGAIGDRLRAC